LGFAAVEPFHQAREALASWISAGYQGTLQYMLSGGDRADPARLARKSVTIVMVAMGSSPRAQHVRRLPLLGQIAAYAEGPDYHGALRAKLAALGQLIADHSGRPIEARACVDTAPLLEREAARRAGIGFIGKSNMLILPGVGSQVLLGALLVDLAIAPDAPSDHRCGRCTACLDACPTQAFVGPWLLDARRCIAYLTIEYQGWIPYEFRPLIGTRIFGCDVCQDVCPFNHGTSESPNRDGAVIHSVSEMNLEKWLRVSSSDYRRLTSGSALRRASRRQLLRNAAVAAGNSGDLSMVEPLAILLARSIYPIVRGHSAWALGQFHDVAATAALEQAKLTETHPEVAKEIARALEERAAGRG
jgi:epoxyqueuosine reductase